MSAAADVAPEPKLTGEEQAHVCGVCRSTLARVNVPGRTDPTWRHTQAWVARFGEDHQPMATPLLEALSAQALCDFCAELNTDHVFGWRQPIVVVLLNPDTQQQVEHRFSRTWSACERCAQYVRTRNKLALIGRVGGTFRRRGLMWAPGMEQRLDLMYSVLFGLPFVESTPNPTDPFGLNGLTAAWDARDASDSGEGR
jgi:hypothetical protein